MNYNNVVVAEPDGQTRETLVLYASAAGFAVEEVSSGKALLEKITRDDADIYISALQFPDITVFDILQTAMRQPVILVTVPQFDLAPAIEAVGMGAYDYVMLPPNAADVRFTLQRAQRYLQLLRQSEELQQVNEIKAEIHALKKTLTHVQESYYTTLEALVTALDAREHETANHSKRVSAYALHLATAMKLSKVELEDVSLGSLLHDIGKIGVADAVLLKPGPLDDVEWVEMKRHPGIGFRILKDIKQLKNAAQIVLTHQEKFDGSGYPRRMKRERIPIGSRIFAVVDCLDAMTSDRPYRRATSLKKAKDEIARQAGVQFDPDIVDAFLDVDDDVWNVIHQTLS